MVQENSMESQSLDVSEQNSLQMTSTQQQQSEQQSLSSELLSQNANLSQHAPTSFSRDMFPQQTVGQPSASDSVSTCRGAGRSFNNISKTRQGYNLQLFCIFYRITEYQTPMIIQEV